MSLLLYYVSLFIILFPCLNILFFRLFNFFIKRPWFVTLSAQLKGSSKFLIWVADGNEEELYHKGVGGLWSPAISSELLHLPGSLSAMRWHHLCFSLNTLTDRIVAMNKDEHVESTLNQN